MVTYQQPAIRCNADSIIAMRGTMVRSLIASWVELVILDGWLARSAVADCRDRSADPIYQTPIPPSPIRVRVRALRFVNWFPIRPLSWHRVNCVPRRKETKCQHVLFLCVLGYYSPGTMENISTSRMHCVVSRIALQVLRMTTACLDGLKSDRLTLFGLSWLTILRALHLHGYVIIC